jgi:formate-dependent nitrite reductase cytochrome c552 subunit
MIKTFLITICFCTSVLANDIYVSQAPDKPVTTEENKPAFIEQKPVSSEKELISNTPNNTYCSVIAGCINSQ